MNWQPIETAPKDGSPFLAFGSYVYEGDTAPTIYMGVAEYSDEPNWPWRDAEGLHRETFYSHWMPLPAAPSPSQGEGPAADVVAAVKPLVWEEIHQRRSDEDPSTEVIGFEASNGFGEWYWIDVRAADFVLHYPDADGSTKLFETERDTKAAAQKDYEKRILSALAHPLPFKDEPGEAVAPKEAFYAGFGAGEANGKFDDDNVDDAWSRYLAHPHPHTLPLKEEVEWEIPIEALVHGKNLLLVADAIEAERFASLVPHECARQLRAADEYLVSAPRIRAGAQEGWKLVPEEPTGPVAEAIAKFVRQRAIPSPSDEDQDAIYFDNGHARELYRVMLLAAPSPEAKGGQS